MMTALDSSWTATWFLRTNQNALTGKTTNEFASFCLENSLCQMIIFITLSNGARIHSLKSFVIKTTKILYDLSLYYVKQIWWCA